MIKRAAPWIIGIAIIILIVLIVLSFYRIKGIDSEIHDLSRQLKLHEERKAEAQKEKVE